MQTSAKYLHLKGMPTVLPYEFFPHELNQALMATFEDEIMATGMALAGYLTCQGEAPDLEAYQKKVVDDNEDGDLDKLQDEWLHKDITVKMVRLMIMDCLKKTLDKEDGELEAK